MSIKWKIFLAVVLVMGTGLLSASFAADKKANYKYKWKMSQVMPAGSDFDIRAKAFAKEVKERTDGRIDITVHSAGVLGDWIVCDEMVMRGDLALTLTPIAPTYDPRLNIGYYMPYLFTSTEEAKVAYSRGGWLYNMVTELLEDQGVKGLGLLPIGWAGMTATKEPKGWKEMKSNGMKIRSMPLKANELTWQQLGYIPSTIPYSEAFSAIERGVCDAQCGGPPFQGYQFRDIQGVWIQYNDYLEPWWFMMNMEKYNSLTEHDQNIMIEAAERQIQGRWDFFLKEDENYRQKMKDYGLEIIIPTEAELKTFADAVRKNVWPELENLMGKTLVDKCRKEVGLLGK